MKFSLYITTKGINPQNWYLKSGIFYLAEYKLSQLKPDYFDTMEAARSKMAELKQKGEEKEIFIHQWTSLQLEKASIKDDEQ
jgi:hypothetical protein